MLRKMSSRLVSLVSLLLILSSITSIAAQDDNPLPAPTGSYAVGVQWRHWVDESRDETFDAEPHGKREMMVGIFYPTDASATGERATYVVNRDEVMSGFSEIMHGVGIESLVTSADVAGFESYAVLNAPLSDAQSAYPVLIFSHGAGGELTMYTAQHEELASHGYVVVAINHAYGAAATVFPDGRTVFPDLSLGLDGTAPFWSQDQIFVMDQLEQVNANDPENLFTNRLNLENLGIFGQSLGGAATTMTCFVDARCKAGASEDGPVYGDVIEQGLEQPFLYLYVDGSFFADPAFYDHSTGPLFKVKLDGFGHLDFSDLPLWGSVQPIRDAGWLGTIEPARAIELTRAYLVAFFDKYLKGAEDTLLDVPSEDHPEVTIEASNMNSATEAQGGLSEADALAFAERFNAIFDGPNLEIADEIMAENFVGHAPLAPVLDRQGWKDYVASFYAGMSDLKEEVNEVIVSEDRVVLRVTYTGTHDGPFFGIPATGTSVTFDGIGIFRFDENGLAVENWAVVDVVGLMAQIGAFPPPQ